VNSVISIIITRCVLRLVGESEYRESDEVMCARWGESEGEWTGWGSRNEAGRSSSV